MDSKRLVELCSDAFGCEWDVGTKANAELAGTVDAVRAALLDAGLSAAGEADVLTALIENAMYLDADDAGRERLWEIVHQWLTDPLT